MKKAADELLPLVFMGSFAKLAGAQDGRRSTGQTLQPTALVHEAWLRLTGAENKSWDSRGISSPPPPKRCGVS
jgi:hypothetical protein